MFGRLVWLDEDVKVFHEAPDEINRDGLEIGRMPIRNHERLCETTARHSLLLRVDIGVKVIVCQSSTWERCPIMVGKE